MTDDAKKLRVLEEDIYFSKNTSTQLIEVRDKKTDQLIAIQNTLDDFQTVQDKMIEIVQTDGSKVLLQNGISEAKMNKTIKNRKRYEYSQPLAEIIIEQMIEGKTLKAICEQDGYPSYAQICRWRNEREDFSKAIETARQYRAEYFHDSLVDETNKIGDALEKEEVAARKLKTDNLKWLTERNDKTRYGSGKTEQKGADSGAIKIVVNTGINRDTDTDVIEIKSGD